jgi:hypothetical protein
MTTTTNCRRLALGLATIGLTALALTGCGSSDDAGGSAPATTAGATSATAGATGATTATAPSGATPSSTAGAPGGSADAIDVCATLPAAQAATLSGEPLTKAAPLGYLQAHEFGCGYGNDDDSIQLEVTVFAHDAASSYDVFVSGSKDVTTVNGLGDKAFFDNDGTMYVLAGSDLIQVNGLDTADLCAALARPVLAAL